MDHIEYSSMGSFGPPSGGYCIKKSVMQLFGLNLVMDHIEYSSMGSFGVYLGINLVINLVMGHIEYSSMGLFWGISWDKSCDGSYRIFFYGTLLGYILG